MLCFSLNVWHVIGDVSGSSSINKLVTAYKRIWEQFSFYLQCLSCVNLSKQHLTNGQDGFLGSLVCIIKPLVVSGDAEVDGDSTQRRFQMPQLHFPIDRDEDIIVTVPRVNHIWRLATFPLPINQTIDKAILQRSTSLLLCIQVLVLLVRIRMTMYVKAVMVTTFVSVLLVDIVWFSASMGWYSL